MSTNGTSESSRWPFGMSRADAAAYIGVSDRHFDKMVADGSMPAPRRTGSRLLWTKLELEVALLALPQDGDDGGANDWDTAA